MKIHESKKCGSIGKVDSWGYGSTSSCYETPTLLKRYWHLTSSVGGFSGPPLGVIRYPDCDTGGYGPFRDTYNWGSATFKESPFYFRGEDGRCYVRLPDYAIGEFANEFDCLDWFEQQGIPCCV